jgi:hypothetical protein
MVKFLLPALCAIGGTQALWLAVANMDYSSAVGTAIFGSPYCQVGKGNTQDEAISKAGKTVGSTILLAGGHCNQMPYSKTNQLGGFWNDHGTVNYIDSNWHWYCNINTGKYTSGSCDAGGGAPRKKREVEFAA